MRHKKKNLAALQRTIFNELPEAPKPKSYFSITEPQQFSFPLNSSFLQGFKLLQTYQHQQANQKIAKKFNNVRIKRMNRYKKFFCLLGSYGNGLLINQTFLNVQNVTAFSCNDSLLLIAYQDLSLSVYSMRQYKQIKQFKNLSRQKIEFIKILQTPKQLQKTTIILSYQGNKIIYRKMVHSIFSKMLIKQSKQIISSLQHPVTQILQIPKHFKSYLQQNIQYKYCSLVSITAVNVIYILKINFNQIQSKYFITVDYMKKNQDVTTNSVSWGQTNIQCPTRFISGDKLVLTYTFALTQFQNYTDGRVSMKYKWQQSYPLTVDQGPVAFCQFIKKSQIIIITQDNRIIIFITKQFDLFQDQISTSKIQKIQLEKQDKFSTQQYLQARKIGTIPKPRLQSTQALPQSLINNIDRQQEQLLRQQPLVTFADTFQYQYPSTQIYVLTQHKIYIYHYCHWNAIITFMKGINKYQSAMKFLISIYQKANKFSLGVQNNQAKILQGIKSIVVQYIDRKLKILKNTPQTLKQLSQNHQYFNRIVIPIQFLIQTQQFDFLFKTVKFKIISALSLDQQTQQNAQKLFYIALCKFIQYARIKYIPSQQLSVTLNYFVATNNLNIIDRLAIFIDLSRINRKILIDCLIQNNLAVSLAHVCIQDKQKYFLLPFKHNCQCSMQYLQQGNTQFAFLYAVRTLWYVQLCLQRHWALKQYSYTQYSEMIKVLTKDLLRKQIILNLLKLKTFFCLQALALYFTAENSQIICQMSKNDLHFQGLEIPDWIKYQQRYQQLQLFLVAIQYYLKQAIPDPNKFKAQLNLFLSSTIIYRKVKFTNEKYFEILLSLIQNYQTIKQFKYGLQQITLQIQQNKLLQLLGQNQQIIQQKVLAAVYINKIITNIFYQCKQWLISRLPTLLSNSAKFKLTDVQSYLNFIQGKFYQSIELYRYAEGRVKNLVFQYLPTSLSTLLIQKRNEDKKKFSVSIARNIQWLAQLDNKKIISIISVYMPQNINSLINALSNNKNQQLKFLQTIINDEQSQSLKSKLNENTIIKFTQLMAQNIDQSNRDQLLIIFKKNPKFINEQTLRICIKYKVYDCMQYLYLRVGNISDSVKTGAIRVDQLISQYLQQNSYQNYNEGEQQNNQQSTPLKQLQQKVTSIFTNTIQICQKNHSQQIWQVLFDSYVSLSQKKYPTKNHKILYDIEQLLCFTSSHIMEHLAANCSIQHTIDFINNKYKGMSMGGGMSRAFTNTLSNLSHSININYIVKQLIVNYLQQQLVLDFQSKLTPYRTSSICQACKFGLIKTQKSVHFKCGHAYHPSCIVSKQPKLCISCLKKQSQQFDHYINTFNPQYPKITKIKQLYTQFSKISLQMSQNFQNQQYRQANQKQYYPLSQTVLQKKNKFLNFDQDIKRTQSGNRNILAQLDL